MLTPLNRSLIQSAVRRTRTAEGLDKDSTAFIYLILDKIYPTKDQTNSEIITDGPDDFGIDAIFIKEHSDRVQVDLLSFKYRESESPNPRNFEGNEIAKIRRFLDDLHNQDEEAISHANTAIQRHCRDIWNFIKQGMICNFRVILVSNGLGLAENERKLFNNYCRSHDFVDFEEIDFHSVVRLIAGPNKIDERAQLLTVDFQIFDRSDGDIRGVVANVDAISLIDSIKDSKTDDLKRHLFNDNIRIYLGDDGGYNRNIIKSATSEDNHLLWYLNNGITIVCEKVSYQKGTRNAPVCVENFQIVNGAQTCNALYNVYKKSKESLVNVLVLVKIFETSRNDITRQVAIATNSQARINLRDLHANDEIQLKIESIFKSIGYAYERKKNQYFESDQEVRVDALKLGQMILSYIHAEPDRARADSDSIFGSRYNRIFNEKLSADTLKNLVLVFREIEKRRDGARLLERSTSKTPDADNFLNYGQWYILYTVSQICQEEGIKFPRESDISNYVDRAQEVVADVVGNYKTWAYYDMFRSPKLREKIDAKYFSKQLSLPLSSRP